MLLVGYLYGIKSERRLEEEINYNIANKWFCGLELTEKAPDATTISQNRRRRFRDNNIPERIFNIPERIFNEILRQSDPDGGQQSREGKPEGFHYSEHRTVEGKRSVIANVHVGRIYARRKQTIERSFAEAKVNHGLRYARMFGIRNMREQCFLTAAVQNIKRLVASRLCLRSYCKPCFIFECRVCQ